METPEHDQTGLSPRHEAMWLRSPGGSLERGGAAAPSPGEGEIVVRVRAVAVNPIDAMGGLLRRVAIAWLDYPSVPGSDAAGEIVAVGPSVGALKVGDRVVGYAVGIERSRNSAAEGAFQTHVRLLSRISAQIPEAMSFEEAVVLPMGLTTAAAGLFEQDQLALELPRATPTDHGGTVLVFGGATSVGMNAIQLARSAGYDVVATASTRNFPLLQSLGAGAVFDYHDPDVLLQLIGNLAGRHLVGTLAIANATLRQAIAVNASAQVTGTRRIASARPTPATKIRGLLARRQGIQVTVIWGGTPKDTAVGPAIWNTFLPAALAEGRYVPAPSPVIAGHGLEAIPVALDRLRQGAHAEKFVVTL